MTHIMERNMNDGSINASEHITSEFAGEPKVSRTRLCRHAEATTYVRTSDLDLWIFGSFVPDDAAPRHWTRAARAHVITWLPFDPALYLLNKNGRNTAFRNYIGYKNEP